MFRLLIIATASVAYARDVFHAECASYEAGTILFESKEECVSECKKCPDQETGSPMQCFGFGSAPFTLHRCYGGAEAPVAGATCAAEGESCSLASGKCCDGLSCYEETACVKSDASNTCAAEGESCGLASSSCCDGLSCYEETACVKSDDAAAPTFDVQCYLVMNQTLVFDDAQCLGACDACLSTGCDRAELAGEFNNTFYGCEP